jgi:hypothetical protein
MAKNITRCDFCGNDVDRGGGELKAVKGAETFRAAGLPTTIDLCDVCLVRTVAALKIEVADIRDEVIEGVEDIADAEAA